MVLDARTLIDHARIEAQNHRFSFNEVRAFLVLSYDIET